MYVCVMATADTVWARDLKFRHSSVLVTLEKKLFFHFWFFSRVMPLFWFSPLPTVLISNQRHSIIYWWFSKFNGSKESWCEVEYEAYDKTHIWRISMFFFCCFKFQFFIFSRVMPLFRFFPLPTVLISNRRHSIIYWWISKSNSSKESCCEVEYEAYDKIHMWRISIVFLHILIFYLIISNQRHSIIYWWISKSNSSKESCCEVEYEVYDKIHMWRISIVFLHILIFYLMNL